MQLIYPISNKYMASVLDRSSLFSSVLMLFLIHSAQCDAQTKELPRETQEHNLCIKIFNDSILSPSIDLVALLA
jgi:hypothetical protein